MFSPGPLQGQSSGQHVASLLVDRVHPPRSLCAACFEDEAREILTEWGACVHGLPYRRPELHESDMVGLHGMPGSIHVYKFGSVSSGSIHYVNKGSCPAPDELARLLKGPTLILG